jgi:hypothetical protein
LGISIAVELMSQLHRQTVYLSFGLIGPQYIM